VGLIYKQYCKSDDCRDDERQIIFQIYSSLTSVRFQRNCCKSYFFDQLRNCIYTNIDRQPISGFDIHLYQTESAVFEEQTALHILGNFRCSNGCKLEQVVFNKKAVSITGLENPMWQLITSFITVAVFIGLKQGFSIYIEPGHLIPILVLGVINTGIGCYFYFSSIGDLRAQTVAILGYLEPLSALFYSAIFLGESLRSIQLIGAVLILGGAVLGELFRKKQVLGLSVMVK